MVYDEIIEEKQKIPLVLFSGGIDSTANLLMTLMHQHCDVLEVRSNILNYPEQRNAEHIARNNIINKLNAKPVVAHGIRTRYKFEFDFSKLSTTNRDTIFGQPLVWLYAAMNVVTPDRHSEVHIAYIPGDDICYVLKHLQKAWDELWYATKPGNPVSLVFPFINKCFMRKEAIVEYMEEHFPGILKLTSYCENPNKVSEKKFIPCDKCNSCKRMSGLKYHDKQIKRTKK